MHDMGVARITWSKKEQFLCLNKFIRQKLRDNLFSAICCMQSAVRFVYMTPFPRTPSVQLSHEKDFVPVFHLLLNFPLPGKKRIETAELNKSY